MATTCHAALRADWRRHALCDASPSLSGDQTLQWPSQQSAEGTSAANGHHSSDTATPNGVSSVSNGYDSSSTATPNGVTLIADRRTQWQHGSSSRWSSGKRTFGKASTLIIELIDAAPVGAPTAVAGDRVEMHYACLIAQSGCCVDASRSKAFSDRKPFSFVNGQGAVVPGMECGVRSLPLGSLARLHVPSRYAYGSNAAPPIGPDTDLVFEVEILAINEQRAKPRDVWRLRELLMLPPPDPLPSARHLRAKVDPPLEAAELLPDGTRALIVHQAADAVAAALRVAEDMRSSFEVSDCEALGQLALPPSISQAASLPAWLARLRSVVGLPTIESQSYFAFARAHSSLIAEETRVDLGPKLIPGASSIPHAPYGTRWDSKTPMVLTGDRVGWPALNWGWEYWERQHGDHFVTSKQRAPMFHEDQSSDTLMAECTLREAMQYARTSHVSDAAERGDAPLLYINGWDVFTALPKLWDESIDQIPGTIEPLTISEHQRLHAQLGIESTRATGADEPTIRKARSLSKLFVGPVGAITRIHQDNHNAHAWLCNIRGRKLYVLCRPEASAAVAPGNVASKAHGTKYGGRLDPLDTRAQQAARRNGVELFATVLEPGETILAPDGWWHYAVSLTPTITLMNNFWDRANLFGLHDMFYDQVARASDALRREAPGWREVAASPDAPTSLLKPPAEYRAVHAPFVYVRSAPSNAAPVLGILRPRSRDLCSLSIGTVKDGWLCTAEPFERGQHGWLLEDGSKLGLGQLMAKVVTR